MVLQYRHGHMCWCHVLFYYVKLHADLQLGDIEVPLNKLSGQMLFVDGLPKYVFIHIKHSKTDQSGQGM